MLEVYDLLVVCKYVSSAGLSFTQMATFFELVTGKRTSVDDFMRIGERSFTLKRTLNHNWGASSTDDSLPKRLLEPQDGGAQGHVPDLGLMLKEYYEIRGWMPDGEPSQEKLKELEIQM
jgi:aldehyde:ferredoxin oxidoreductase